MSSWVLRIFTVIISLTVSIQINGQDKLDLTEIASDFSIPVAIAHTGDERLFIVEKNGFIRIMDTIGQVMNEPFLDIDAKVNSQASERGLLGLAFHPMYSDNGYFFLNYTNNAGTTTIARFSRDTLDANKADPNSELILFTIPQPFSNHNGGDVVFGPDGYLYIGTGDGGNGGDPGNRAQNLEEQLGKMLRIDVDSEIPYAIPPDNPFSGVDTVVQEIWAYGLRNPWRYSFDRSTGDLWIADVGQDAWEEINFQAASGTGGENYGWRCKEGFANFNTGNCPPFETLTDPVYVYAHTSANCSGSVTGGFVYRGSKHPYFFGKYIFTDFCTGVFRSVMRDTSGAVESEDLANLQNQEFTAIGEDASGELYVAGASGRIYTIQSLVSGIHNVKPELISIWPNPASGSFTIDAVDEVISDISLGIYNTLGECVLEIPSLQSNRVDCSGLVHGVYVVLVKVPNRIERLGKLIINH
jgi:glucose/arabinose dehydrogenase